MMRRIVRASIVMLTGLSSACSLPTDGAKRSMVQLALASQQSFRQLFAPDVTVVERVDVRAEVGGQVVESATAVIPQGQALTQLEIGAPSDPTDFVATVLSNNGTRLLEGSSGPIQAADGEIVEVQLGTIGAIPGLSPDTLVIPMTSLTFGNGSLLVGLGVVHISNFGVGRVRWDFGEVTPGANRCNTNTYLNFACSVAVQNHNGIEGINTGGFLSGGIPDSLFVILLNDVATYEVEIQTESGLLRTIVVGDTSGKGGGSL